MDYEKLHKDTIAKLQEMFNSGKITVEIARGICADFIPESEDERIRKEIIIYLRSILSNKKYGDKFIEDWIAWLEKQGEQKSVEHLELKAGHWYICHHPYCCRADDLTVKEGERFMCEKNGAVKGFIIKEPEKYFIEVSAPAPMEDEQKPAEEYNITGIGSKHAEGKLGEMIKNLKPAWSEEDERMFNSALWHVKNSCGNGGKNSGEFKVYNWLKTLKGRVLPQPKQEWSEEDEKMVGNIRRIIEKYAFSQSAVDVNGDLCEKEFIDADNWLKSLRPPYYCDNCKLKKSIQGWKLSEEQMVALKHAFNNGSIAFADMKILATLYEQLKALYRYEQDT